MSRTLELDEHGRRYVEPVREALTAIVSATPRYPATLPELLVLIAELEAAGCDVGERVKRMQAAEHAIMAAVPDLSAPYLADGLLDLDPAEISRRVRDVTLDYLVRQSDAQRVTSEFRDRLALDVAHALRDVSDAIVTALKHRFDKALAVVQKAADVGLEPTSNAQTIVADGNAKQLTSWRELPAAVADLDQVARLRDQLTEWCDTGPAEYLVAAYLAPGASLAEIEGATNRMRGDTEVVHQQVAWHVTDQRRPVHRTGGGWLDLVTHGYRLRLNTGREAAALLEQALDAARR